jgi:hypothetical protein
MATVVMLRDNFHKLLAIAGVIFVVNMTQLWITTSTSTSSGGVLLSPSLSSSSILNHERSVPSRGLESLFTLPRHDQRHGGGGGDDERQQPQRADQQLAVTTKVSPSAPTRYRTLPKRHGNANKDNNNAVQLLPGDYIYYKNDDLSWDSSPIVIESHKLIFFTIPKVGCTVWKQLFRRMMGHADWSSQDDQSGLPHNPKTNGLVYLHDLDMDRANHIMTSPEWTRAMMVRDPKQRLLSAFLDKSVRNDHRHIIDRCCPVDHACVTGAQTVPGFLKLCGRCHDDHWRPQNDRVDAKFWPYVDEVLHVENAAADAERLLKTIGAWEQYGASGWGKTGQSAIFQRGDGGEHSNFVEWQVWKWYTPAIEQQVVQFYQQDYDHPLFQFDPTTCLTCTTEATVTTTKTSSGTANKDGSASSAAVATTKKKY